MRSGYPGYQLGLSQTVRLIDHHAAARALYLEVDLNQRIQCFAHRLPPIGPDEKEYETASTGAQQLAAQSTGGNRPIVNIIDGAVGNAGGQSPLQHPAFVQELAQLSDWSVGRGQN